MIDPEDHCLNGQMDRWMDGDGDDDVDIVHKFRGVGEINGWMVWIDVYIPM